MLIFYVLIDDHYFKDDGWCFVKVNRLLCNVVICTKNDLKSIGPCAFYQAMII